MAITQLSFTLMEEPLGVSVKVHPIYKQLVLDKDKDPEQMYFKQNIRGELMFKGADYNYLMSRTNVERFVCYISDVNRNKLLATGYFRYYDMVIDTETETIKVKLKSTDSYNRIIQNLDTEYNLKNLAPKLEQVQYKVYECFQFLSALSSKMTSAYERVTVHTDVDRLTPDELYTLAFNNYYHATAFKMIVNRDNGAEIIKPEPLVGLRYITPITDTDKDFDMVIYPTQEQEEAYSYRIYGKKIRLSEFVVLDKATGKKKTFWVEVLLFKVTDKLLYSVKLVTRSLTGEPEYYNLAGDPIRSGDYDHTPYVVENLYAGTLNKVAIVIPIGNSRYSIGIEYSYFNMIGARRLTSNNGELINEDDNLSFSNIYKKRQPLRILDNTIVFSTKISTIPTKYGISKVETLSSGDIVQYYYKPPQERGLYAPVCIDDWGKDFSLWIDLAYLYANYNTGTDIIVNNNNFCEVGEAIKVLLSKIDTKITFDSNSTYSQFLYGNSGLFLHDHTNVNKRLKIMITQRSNVNKPNADNLASEVKITLGSIFTMLRNAFNVYWFIDGNKLKLEHVSYFINNGSYSNNVSSQVLMNRYRDSLNKKAYTYMSSVIEFDISKEYSIHKTKWADETSEPFTKSDFAVIGTADDDNKVHENSIYNFTPDVEYAAVFGKTLNDDGMAVVVVDANTNKVQSTGVDNVLVVNGNMSMRVLYEDWLCYHKPGIRLEQMFGDEDDSGRRVVINVKMPSFIKKSSISFSGDINVPELYTKINTNIGVGHIVKISKNLETNYIRVELMYDRN